MSTIIDLDAGKREATGEPTKFLLNDVTWVWPAELPAAVFDPLFDGQLDDLLALFAEVAGDQQAGADIDVKGLIRMFATNPRLLSGVASGIRASVASLFGDEQWERWLESRPSAQDYLRVGKLAWKTYGVSLGEAWASSSFSGSGGATSRPTSTRKASTRAVSGSPGRTRR